MTALAAADLLTAAAVIREHGWCQHSYVSNGRDISGALAYAASDGKTSMPGLMNMLDGDYSRWHIANGFLHAVIGATSIDAWNDHPSRTVDEVLSALEAAAALAERSARKAAYDEGRWCGECIYGVVMDPPCCTQEAAS